MLCNIIVELSETPTSDSFVSKSAYSVFVVTNVFPVAETAVVVDTLVIPRAVATLPATTPPEIESLPVLSKDAEPPFVKI